MLKQVVGFSKDLMIAKTRAAFFYNQLEVRTRFEFIESQIGANELGEPAWFTTIWYTELPDPVVQKEEEKFEYIGSTDIDPSNPDWKIEWDNQQALIRQEELVDTSS